MLLKNKGQKIVHIGTVMLLPGESKDVADAAAASPAVTMLIGRGTLVKVSGGTSSEVPASDPESGKAKPEKP